MSKKMTLSSRINIVLALVAIFLVILGTNRIDERHFKISQNAVTSVYNDRILAQDYIYKMNNLIHKKQRQLWEGSQTIDVNINNEIETYIDLFADTKLTPNELKTFKRFRTDFENLKFNETKILKNVNEYEGNESFDKNSLASRFDENIKALQTDLNNLSLIQVSETKNILGVAQKSLNTIKLLSRMEIYVMLVVGIIILFFTFYKIGKLKDRAETI
jgi:hypothetical protein